MVKKAKKDYSIFTGKDYSIYTGKKPTEKPKPKPDEIIKPDKVKDRDKPKKIKKPKSVKKAFEVYDSSKHKVGRDNYNESNRWLDKAFNKEMKKQKKVR